MPPIDKLVYLMADWQFLQNIIIAIIADLITIPRHFMEYDSETLQETTKEKDNHKVKTGKIAAN